MKTQIKLEAYLRSQKLIFPCEFYPGDITKPCLFRNGNGNPVAVEGNVQSSSFNDETHFDWTALGIN